MKAIAVASLLVIMSACSLTGDSEAEAVQACREARTGQTTYGELGRRLGAPDARRDVTEGQGEGWYEATWGASEPSDHDRDTAVFLFADGTLRGSICGFPRR